MGSEYKVIEDEASGVELVLQEMSNTFDLVACGKPDDSEDDITLLKNAAPEKLVDVAFKIIQVAAYWADGKALREMIHKKLAEVYFLDY